VRTLHVGLRVADLDRSLAFYQAVGYDIVGTVPGTPLGTLVMLKLPGDEFVTIELVHDSGNNAEITGPSHLVIKVESMDDTAAALSERGVQAEPPTSPDGSGTLWTTWIVDPDGNRIELVQWHPTHADGMGPADFPN
jgi:lactoylglutathione lyase